MQVDGERPAGDAGCRLDGVRIWVVEDDPEWRGMVVEELEYHGADVRGIDSVEALYRELAVDRCDILVLDVGLPGEDGLSATGHLRRMDGMGIVLVTGRSGTADMAHGLSLGADVYLPKPLELPVLVAALHSLHRRMSQSSPAVVSPGEAVAAWNLRSDGWDLHAPNGRVLTLTAAERGFLRELFAVPGEQFAQARGLLDDEQAHSGVHVGGAGQVALGDQDLADKLGGHLGYLLFFRSHNFGAGPVLDRTTSSTGRVICCSG